MNDLSIAAIKRLSDQGGLSDSDLQILKGDPRAGVQALVARVLRRQEAAQRALERVEEMLEKERELWGRGVRLIAGVDEVGVGPLAGPVVAAAVILAPDARLPGVDDSKKLSHARRVELSALIRREAVDFAVGRCEPKEIDEHNIYQASRLAMFRAVSNLKRAPEHLLVDARRVPHVQMGQTSLIRGDSRSHSIAAASIVAKVERDVFMERLALKYPGYGFEKHRGYGTAEHLAALEALGPAPVHRRSFSPVAEAEARHGSTGRSA